MFLEGMNSKEAAMICKKHLTIVSECFWIILIILFNASLKILLKCSLFVLSVKTAEKPRLSYVYIFY